MQTMRRIMPCYKQLTITLEDSRSTMQPAI